MTLRELLEVVENEEPIYLRIKNRYYTITKDYYNILRPEIFDMEVTKLMASTLDGDVCVDISLEAQVKEVTSDDDNVGMDLESMQRERKGRDKENQ